MARIEFEDFPDNELTRVYLAGELHEAKRVEEALTEHGIDYAVDFELYKKRIIGLFPAVYQGVAFFVVTGQTALARSTLLAAGLRAGIEEDDEPR